MEYEHSQAMCAEFERTQQNLRQPHVYMRPKVYRDGNKWCCILGDDMMINPVAFGDTPEQACWNWDLVWINGDTLAHKPADKP